MTPTWLAAFIPAFAAAFSITITVVSRRLARRNARDFLHQFDTEPPERPARRSIADAYRHRFGLDNPSERRHPRTQPRR